jgi:hypothetical protein
MLLPYSPCLALSLAILFSAETLVLLSPVLILHKTVLIWNIFLFLASFHQRIILECSSGLIDVIQISHFSLVSRLPVNCCWHIICRFCPKWIINKKKSPFLCTSSTWNRSVCQLCWILYWSEVFCNIYTLQSLLLTLFQFCFHFTKCEIINYNTVKFL